MIRNYSEHVLYVLGRGKRPTSTSAESVGRITIQPVVDQLKDPLADIVTAADQIDEVDGGKRPPIGWMQRLRRGASRVRVRPSGAITFEGRVCCYEYLRQFEGRRDIPLPHETTCPACGAQYRIRLGAVRR